MPYRLVTFDSLGKMIAVNPKSFQDNEVPTFTYVANNPAVYSFISEDLLPKGEYLANLELGVNAFSDFELNGSYIRPLNRGSDQNALYDPRSEIILKTDNPSPYVSFATAVKQDITKTQVTYNQLDETTKPVHSSIQKKFGPTSGKFTRSLSGLTGGSIYVTNIVKRSDLINTAPHNRIGKGNTGTAYSSYGFEMFFYPTSLSNNFTLMQKGLTGASASWKLGYDSGAGFLQFAWMGKSTTGGYNLSQNIVNTAGISLNNWNHVAVSLIREGTTGITYTIKGYFNSTQRFSTTGTASTIPEDTDTGGIYIGNNHLGSDSYTGYIDSLRVFDTDVTGGLLTAYGFYGNTLGVPTLTGFTTSSEICFVMNFNGLEDVDSFYAESQDRMIGVVTRISDLVLGPSGAPVTATVADVGIRDIYRYQYGISGATGYTDDTGFSMGYGPLVFPYATTPGSTVHGYDYVFDIYSVTDLGVTLETFRSNYRYNAMYEAMIESFYFIEGASGNKGSSGNVSKSSLGTNPFGRLFGSCGGNYYGISFNHSALFLNPLDTETLSFILRNGELAGLGICRSSYSFTDGLNFNRTLNAQQIYNLRLDLLDYFNKLVQSKLDSVSSINSATTKKSVSTGKGAKATGSPYESLGNEDAILSEI
jgi:hypothetical protein